MIGLRVGLWIGLAITFMLGLLNFLWGGGILSRRERVLVVDSDVLADFLPKGTREDIGGDIVTLERACLSIYASCDLVLTSGEKDLEVKSVKVKLDKKHYKKLKRYFKIPLRNNIHMRPWSRYKEVYCEKEVFPPPSSLILKRAVRFKRKVLLDCTDEYELKFGEIPRPGFIQPILDEVEAKFQICWTRYDGKSVCWRFPNKWWCNLGKKLWG